MPYKIVQTVEKGELCLCVVPSRWEEKGVLYWPKKSVVARLSHDENSCPNANWEKLNCVLKREFLSYDDAHKELEKMESNADTEVDENELSQPKAKKIRRKNDNQPLRSVVKDFNVFLTNPQTDKDNCSVEETPMNTDDKVLHVDGSSVVYVEERIVDEPDIPTNIDAGEMQPRGSLPIVTEGDAVEPSEVNEVYPEPTLTTVVTNQAIIHNNQLKIMTSLAQLITTVEILGNKVLSIEKNLHAESRTPVANVVFKQVNSREDLDRLEAELKEETNMKRYVEKLSIICGTSGKSDGIDSAYRLIDYMATRQMVSMCSWTGLARENPDPTGTHPDGSNEMDMVPSKIPLKFYGKFRELFFRVVRLADQDFSEASCEKFLKGIMKNSKQRLASKVTSTHKNRPKNLKYGAKKDEDNNLDK